MVFRGLPQEVEYVTKEDFQRAIEELKQELRQTQVKTYYVQPIQTKDRLDEFLRFGHLLILLLIVYILFLIFYTLYQREK